jgi:hypothetical protein
VGSATSSNLQDEGRGWRSLLIAVLSRAAAVFFGVFLAFFVFVSSFSDTTFSGELFVRMGVIVALYGALGIVFGLASPRPSWHWGLWLYAPNLLLLIGGLLLFFWEWYLYGEPIVDFWFVGFAAGLFGGSLITACLGAYAGAQFRHHFSSESGQS